MERAQAGRHMHINDLVPIFEQSRNKYIILMHVTQRTGIGEIRRIVRSKCPKDVCEKIIVLEEDQFGFLGTKNSRQ
jgi:ribonuclease BN (tRNA processing enzyme)